MRATRSPATDRKGGCYGTKELLQVFYRVFVALLYGLFVRGSSDGPDPGKGEI